MQESSYDVESVGAIILAVTGLFVFYTFWPSCLHDLTYA